MDCWGADRAGISEETKGAIQQVCKLMYKLSKEHFQMTQSHIHTTSYKYMKLVSNIHVYLLLLFTNSMYKW